MLKFHDYNFEHGTGCTTASSYLYTVSLNITASVHDFIHKLCMVNRQDPFTNTPYRSRNSPTGMDFHFPSAIRTYSLCSSCLNAIEPSTEIVWSSTPEETISSCLQSKNKKQNMNYCAVCKDNGNLAAYTKASFTLPSHFSLRTEMNERERD